MLQTVEITYPGIYGEREMLRQLECCNREPLDLEYFEITKHTCVWGAVYDNNSLFTDRGQ